MKSASRSFLSTVRSRAYAAQAAGKQAEQKLTFSPQNAKLTRLPSGVIVASLENYSPVSRVAVVYNAGPRYEPVGQLGLTHCLRAASNLSSQKASAFGIARSLQQIGASLSCTTTKEQMYYTVTCKRDDLSMAAQFLADVAVAPAFKPWEMETLTRRLRLDLELLQQSPNVQLVEALHKAAFRDTLGRSLYMNADRIGSYTPQNLESFVKSHYVSGNAVVAGLGVDHGTLVKLAEKMNITQGNTPTTDATKAKYYGGELRVDVKSKLVHAAVVTEGISATGSEMMALLLLESALNTTPQVQYGTGLALSRINKAISAATKSEFAANSICAAYSDAGLFGVQVVASPQEVGKVLKAAVGVMGQITKTGITEDELKIAKRKLKAGLRMYGEDAASALEWLASDILVTGDFVSADVLEKAIDVVTLDMVNKVAKRIINGKPTMAAVGDLVNTPYLDQLL
jgi:ubiquinol-cytochrome c reductase core subunit 2